MVPPLMPTGCAKGTAILHQHVWERTIVNSGATGRQASANVGFCVKLGNKKP